MITQPKLSLRVRAATPLEAFAADLSGELLLPGHPEYDSARKIWNGMFDRRPAMIVRCADAADVSRALKFARGQGLQIAVRGGGHNSAGHAMVDDGLVIDLSHMKKITVNPLTLTALAEPGLTLGEF